ncbi:MAG: deoxyribodipyrimidine photo-lyase [Methylotenera sp.]|nr:deoxyribodipyrimidine photo-lyase [Oligoflexia bacterium]
MKNSYGIHWFRRDLRVRGNVALTENHRRHQGRVVGIFAIDQKILDRKDFSHSRFSFYLKTLQLLKKDMVALGGDLLFLDTGPQAAFPELLEQLKKSKHGLPDTFTWNRDYEPFAIQRDCAIEELLQNQFKIQTETRRDHLLIEPHELYKPGKKSGPENEKSSPFYQVFTPFKRKWLTLLNDPDFKERVEEQRTALHAKLPEFKLTWKELLGENNGTDALIEGYLERSLAKTSHPLPEPGPEAALRALTRFEKEALAGYSEGRDIPSIPGTSQLSIYFKNGSITVPQVVAALNLDGNLKADSSQEKYLSELIWREFYYHILNHFPSVEKTAFNKKYTKLDWENRADLFKAWCEGRTGYPIVDAGMRQLNQTGWMHNRVRMIVASFLTKDLLIDWKKGEAYFMQYLLDGDLAPNNGGWQWAASTGCDPQPYFRIFNPTSQSERFDPQGIYLKRWIPELKDFSPKEIHEPHLSSRKTTYPKPIVEHATQRGLALTLFKTARAQGLET